MASSRKNAGKICNLAIKNKDSDIICSTKLEIMLAVTNLSSISAFDWEKAVNQIRISEYFF